jgi:hypothetical protein
MINAMYEAMTVNAPEPAVGMGATMTGYTDRHAGTVVSWDGKIVSVQHDDVRRTDGNGMSDAQSYEFTPNPNAPVEHYRRDKADRWVRVVRNEETGRWNSKDYGGLILGFRDHYYDFSF